MFTKKKRKPCVPAVLFSLGSLALSGCSHSPMPYAPPSPGPVAEVAQDQGSYRIQVGDVLQIRLPLLPEFSDEVTVRPDGRISTSLVPDLPAANKTVPELTAMLRQSYAKDLKNPLLAVNIKTYAPYRVYVAGEVVTPGEYISPGPNLTLSQAIARAGGLKLSGEPDDVFIVRRGPNDEPRFLATKYRRVMRGSDPSGDVRLARYDVVYVPRTTIAEVYLFFNQYLQQFVPVSWGFSYLVGNSGGTNNVVQAPASVTR